MNVLWYYKEKIIVSDVKYIIMSSPRKPVGEMKSSLLEAGRQLASFLRSLDKRVVMAISGDLSHTYPTDCQDPLYLPDPR